VARPRGQVVSPSQRPGDPENIPHDDEERGAATTSNPETETQVSGHVRPELLVTDSARTTLSRWRHGFEPRWDYASQRPYPGIVSRSGPALAPRTCRGPSRLTVPRKVGTWDPWLYSCPTARPRRFASIPLGAGLASLTQQRRTRSTRALGSRRQVRPHDQSILRTRRRRGLAGLRGVPLTARGVIPLGL
jgi:hypothetical protein